MININLSLEFKGDKYSITELIKYRATGKNIYKEGEVKDLYTGEIVDIQNIEVFRERYKSELLQAVNVLSDKKTGRLAWAVKENLKELRLEELNKKFEGKCINLDELYELIHLKKDSKREPLSIHYENFITLNVGVQLPNSLTHSEKGKFHDMLYFLSYDNQLQHTPRKNGRKIKMEDLMKYLELSNYKSYRRFMSKLSKNNILIELKNTSNNKVIMLNPVYVNRNIRIDYTTYLSFKKEVTPYLSKEEIAYLEMLGTGDDMMSTYEII